MDTSVIKNPPKHVGIIMDGNGRWATARNKERSFGHKQGAAIIKDVALFLFESGVEYLSLYAFSTENFSRPEQEVNELFDVLDKGIEKYGNLAKKQRIKLIVSGDLTPLSDSLKQKIDKYVKLTERFDLPVLNICINYGARQELCRAFSLMLKDGVSNVNESTINEYTYTANLPDIDLIIRTGGEQRLSNFLLWQSAYAELYFTNVLWPDFNKENALDALLWYQSRNRRFGKV